MKQVPLIAGVDVRVAGTQLPIDGLLEVRVEQHLLLPDACSFVLADPRLQHVDEQRFAPGTDLAVSFAGAEQQSLALVFSGKIAAVEPEFAREQAILRVRGYDLSHQLNRTPRTRAFQQMSVADIVRKVAKEGGLAVGSVDSTGGPVEFVQQSNETDWQFLWRLAAGIDFAIGMDGAKLSFRSVTTLPKGQPVKLTWGEGLRQLRPRVTGVQQVDRVQVNGWDPKARQAITAEVRIGAGDGSIGITRSAAAAGLGGGGMTIADRPVGTAAEARALAESTAARLGNAYLEAEGAADGDPRIRAGVRLTIDGVGRRFGGTYLVSAVQHTYRGTTGYETRFTVSGRSTRTLLDLVAPPPQRPWGTGLVVGVVTNNNDPDGLGRVRVRYPVLGEAIESWWARLAVPGAGAGRGVVMLPVAGDEVVVGFEHGDPRRPYVLGALHNGKAKPGPLVHKDGSLHIHSNKEIVVEAVGNTTVTGDADLTVTYKGKKTEDVKQEVTLTAGSMETDVKGPVTIKSAARTTIESSGPLEIRAGDQLSIQCSGIVRISGAQVELG